MSLAVAMMEGEDAERRAMGRSGAADRL